MLDANVPHLALARHLLPLLAEGGRAGGYVLIDGPGGEHPWAGYGHRSIGTAAVRMLARVLHDEARALSVRVQMVSLDWPVRTEQQRRARCMDGRRSASAVVLALIERRDRAPTEAIVHCTGPCPEQKSDSDDDPLHARCMEDARTLPTSLSPASPSPLSTKEDIHEPPTRR